MNLAEQRLSEATRIATTLGYRIHFDWLDGCGGGLVTTGGEQWILLDRGQPSHEQLDIVLRCLTPDARVAVGANSVQLLNTARRAA